MYIRKITQTQKNGKYVSYRLCQTYRNADGKVRQAMILNLGSGFSVPEDKWKRLADRIEEIVLNKTSLFELTLPSDLESKAKSLAKQVIKKGQALTLAKPSYANEEIETDYHTVDINSTESSEVRFIGGEHLGLHAAMQLDLKDELLQLGFNYKQANIALASIIGRLICPGSELRTHRYLTQESALDELLEMELNNLPLQQLYSIADKLHDHKEALEDALYKKECDLFALSEVITLFDITNTYFEGHPSHDGAKRGRSKEKRSDCQLISLGIVLDGSGFPKKSKILPGNISEPSTLQDMLINVDSSATVIMDAGIASKDNVEYLKAKGYKYIVVKRDSSLTMPDDASPIVVKADLHNEVTVSLLSSPEYTDEVELYCHSSAKEEQTREYINRTCQNLEDELNKLNNGLATIALSTDTVAIKDGATAVVLNIGAVYVNTATPKSISNIIKIDISEWEQLPLEIKLKFSRQEFLSNELKQDQQSLELIQKYTGQVRLKSKVLSVLKRKFGQFIIETKQNTTKEYNKVVERIGRLKEHYKSVAYMYDLAVIPDAQKNMAVQIKFAKQTDKLEAKQSGIYCLRSNRTDLDAKTLWETYTMLTDLESAFRSLKSELGMRPIYHQLKHRIDGHIFISLLAYHLLHTIRYQLKQSGINHSWNSIRNIMSTQVRTTISQNLQKGGVVQLRKTSRATVEQMQIYNALGISSPGKVEKSYFFNKPQESVEQL